MLIRIPRRGVDSFDRTMQDLYECYFYTYCNPTGADNGNDGFYDRCQHNLLRQENFPKKTQWKDCQSDFVSGEEFELGDEESFDEWIDTCGRESERGVINGYHRIIPGRAELDELNLFQYCGKEANMPSSATSPSSATITTTTIQSMPRRKKPVVIERRNQRERVRVRAVNEAFARLRQMVPATRLSAKRVSKVKTLKRAVEYINDLRRCLVTFEGIFTESPCAKQPTRWKAAAGLGNCEPFQLK
ncbi:uncharacterized protein LOC129780495 [Toxorhynchites rutilus septentrionalis]|uniref:uncharacterized protein LOC129780495 n=1 Tax=Toxorhynchites rutilus septentrionalis TaxID=329112 RepID=UPI002479A173|nr:uncharacterized protein LOC129780495 [Toxorhynchites rutilus septentrionalis]